MTMVFVILPMTLTGCFSTRTFYTAKGAKNHWDTDLIYIYQDSTLVISSRLPFYENRLDFHGYIDSQGQKEIYVKDLDLSIEDSGNKRLIPIESYILIVSNDSKGGYTQKIYYSDLPDSIKSTMYRDYNKNNIVSFYLDKIAFRDIPDSCKYLKIRENAVWPDAYRFDPERMIWCDAYDIGLEKQSDLSLICHAVIVRDGKEFIIDRKIKIFLKKRVVFVLNYT